MTNRGLRTVLAAAFLVCALACGGSGGHSDPEPELSVEVDRSSLELTVEEGVTEQASLVATAPRFEGPLHVRATVDGSGLDLVETASHESYALVMVRSAAALAPGTYQGTLTVEGCADAACEAQLGSPVRVPFAVTVLRRLVTPNPVTLGAISGSTAEATVQVVLPPRATGFDVAVTAGASWLTVTDRTAVGFRVRAAARPRGTYQGALRFTAGDEVRVVQVVYDVAPRPIAVTPNPVVLEATSGASARTGVRVALPDDASEFQVGVDSAGGWLTAEDRTTDGVTLVARSLPAGEYRGTATLVAGGSTMVVPVVYEVSPPAGGERGIRASPASLTFTATEGAPSAVRLLEVAPPTWNPALQAQVEYEATGGWLAVTTRSGGYDVQANAGALLQGTYAASIVLSGDAYTQELRVPVTLTVGPGLVRPPDRVLTITAETTPDDLLGSTPITLVGRPAQSWSARSDAAWLVLESSTGTTGEALRYHVDLTHVAEMTYGAEERATIEVQAGSTVTPTSFRVTLTKALSVIARVTPYAQPAGQANRFLVRGRGFDLLGDLADRVILDGIGPATATRRSDEELEIRVPAAAAGTYTVRIASGLELPSSSAKITLFEPGPLPSAKFLQAGTKRGLRYDPVRRTVYLVNEAQRAIFRYHDTGAGWEHTQRAIPALEDIGLSPEGDTLLAATGQGLLLLLDPDTLETRAEIPGPDRFLARSFGTGIPVLNDGRAWLAAGTNDRAIAALFDVSAQAFTPGPAMGFFYGPYFSASRDGERLLVCITNSLSPPPPIQYVDAIDGVTRTAPTSERGFVMATQSDDAGRVLLDSGSVYDRSFAPVGRVELPAIYASDAAGHGAVLSPDGSRAYVLSYSRSIDPPRLYVVDTSRAPAAGPTLPILGSHDLVELPQWDSSEYWTPRAILAISPDERTLFIASAEALLVIPLPLALDPPPAP